MTKSRNRVFQLDNMLSKDVYFVQHAKDFNNSITKIVGTIDYEVKHQHGTKLENTLVHAVLINLFERCGFYDMDKQKFVESMCILYDNAQKLKQEMSILNETQKR